MGLSITSKAKYDRLEVQYGEIVVDETTIYNPR